MAALVSVLLTIALSLLITRIAAEALILTGLSREVAQFQAHSAITGSGFTTSESELVVAHPVRRRILMWLMLLSNAGFITVISSLVLTFINVAGPREWLPRLLLLLFGIGLLWLLATNRWFNRFLSHWVAWALRRWTHLDVRDYASLLRLSEDYGVMELQIDPGDWLADKPLHETNLYQEGMLVLGIQRADGSYIGAPQGSTIIYPGDMVILYGRLDAFNELDSRKAGSAGDQAHQEAIAHYQEQIQWENQRQNASPKHKSYK
ncbi:MAG: TrkA C-terminal domain-containing protein [Gloeomargarita sp. HHBFW_bins_162]